MTYTLTIVGNEGDSGTDSVKTQAQGIVSQLPGVSHANLQTGEGDYVDLMPQPAQETPEGSASELGEETSGV